MADIGDFTKAINAQNVLLEVGNDNEVATLFNIRHSSESIIDRVNTRAGPIDTPTFTLDEIIADCTISEDLYDHFLAQRVLSDRGALPSEAFKIIGQAAAVSGADDTELTGNYILRRFEDIAQEQGRYTVTLTMRVTPA